MTTDHDFDPNAPLAGPPDPWDYAPTPSTRSGPPYHMTDMIAAEPALARRLLGRLAGRDGGAAELADAVRATIEAGEPVIVTGCGTSEHGALAAADLLREAATAAGSGNAIVTTEQAFELSLAPPPRGLVIGVTHEGATAATIAALTAACSHVAADTVAALADSVIMTRQQTSNRRAGYLTLGCVARRPAPSKGLGLPFDTV